MDVKIFGNKLQGQIPGIISKSHGHRVLISNYLASSEILPLNNINQDLDATIDCLKSLKYKQTTFKCKESGTTLRLILPVTMALCKYGEFFCDGSLRSRDMKPLLDTLSQNGVTVTYSNGTYIAQGQLIGGDFLLPGNISSQFVSGLLFALPLTKNGGTITLTSPLESQSYVDLTIKVLKDFGIEVKKVDSGYLVNGMQKYQKPKKIEIEKDWSNAGFFLAANALGSDVEIEGLNKEAHQGDKEICHIIQKLQASESVTLNLSDTPDLAPVVALIGAFRSHSTTIYCPRLKYKESNRLASISAMIKSVGGNSTVTNGQIIITPVEQVSGGIVDSFNDHRIVMAAAIIGTNTVNPVTILGAEAVNKSYPNFFEDYVKLGGKIEYI
ncbi:MAG: 3-phosphoshikimate 1-carboxyvinyltransferase [Anaerovoracaceae bacterium]